MTPNPSESPGLARAQAKVNPRFGIGQQKPNFPNGGIKAMKANLTFPYTPLRELTRQWRGDPCQTERSSGHDLRSSLGCEIARAEAMQHGY